MKIDSIHYQTMSYSILFISHIYSKNIAHKYLSHVANNSIQIYSVYNHIGLIDLYLNYNY
jgi:hypothetical protein